MVEISDGTKVETDAPGVFYHVTLASGATMNEAAFRIIEGVLEDEKGTILGRGESSGREIDMGEILAAHPSFGNE